MSEQTPTTEDRNKANAKAATWVALSVPFGCSIGIAIHNLGFGIAIGLVLGSTMAVVQAKKFSPAVRYALVGATVALIAIGFLIRK